MVEPFPFYTGRHCVTHVTSCLLVTTDAEQLLDNLRGMPPPLLRWLPELRNATIGTCEGSELELPPCRNQMSRLSRKEGCLTRTRSGLDHLELPEVVQMDLLARSSQLDYEVYEAVEYERDVSGWNLVLHSFG